MRRRGMAGLMAIATAVATLWLPAPSLAVSLEWSLRATPLSATAGSSTTFQLTATNTTVLGELGCIRLDVTSSFVAEGASIVSVSNGRPWSTGIAGSVVTIQSTTGGGRLTFLGSVTFTVRATPLSAGMLSWSATAYRSQGCSGSPIPGINTVSILVAPAPPTPTPGPTPPPSATPTPPPPTPSPTPFPPGTTPPGGQPSPLPTAAPAGNAASSAGSAPIAAGSGGPGQPSGGQPSPGGAGVSAGAPIAGDAGAPTGAAGSGALLSVGLPSSSGGSLDLGALGIGASLGLWSVPAAAIGGPGLLVLLWVALQALGGLAWLPGTRWMLGEERRRRPRPG